MNLHWHSHSFLYTLVGFFPSTGESSSCGKHRTAKPKIPLALYKKKKVLTCGASSPEIEPCPPEPMSRWASEPVHWVEAAPPQGYADRQHRSQEAQASLKQEHLG